MSKVILATSRCNLEGYMKYLLKKVTTTENMIARTFLTVSCIALLLHWVEEVFHGPSPPPSPPQKNRKSRKHALIYYIGFPFISWVFKMLFFQILLVYYIKLVIFADSLHLAQRCI